MMRERGGIVAGADVRSELLPDRPVGVRSYKIGAVGTGFIMNEVQLAAYAKAGFDVIAVAASDAEKARAVAARWGIPGAHANALDVIGDPAVDILDVAVPPHAQRALVEAAVAQPHIKALLLQKPLAPTLADAKYIVELCERNGKLVSVNQNMRFDQSMQVLKQILDRGWLGSPVTATIEMRAIPHWQEYLKDYNRLTLLNMSIHHLDVMRFLFGEVRYIFVATRQDPRTRFAHRDGICAITLEFASGVLGHCFDDVWASPTSDGFPAEIFIRWRIVGIDGVAKGTIGWPDYPDGSPSTLSFCAPVTERQWVTPQWETMWFPDAFIGVMAQLQDALAGKAPLALDGRDNLRTMALVEAGYASLDRHSAVEPSEFHQE